MSKVLFDPTMNRWLNYYDETVTHQNSIFKEGYDDPTFLTFKVEFGDWGASVLDRSVVNVGTTKFQVNHTDYDQYPMGLLNCPSPDDGHDDSVWQTGASDSFNIFNNTPDYSAFTYLRSRNEDTRAEYIYHFVNGLFEIQANTPYIFKKISGLESLQTFDPKAGQRIKDAKITLECYEGLDLKIKTLMEFYRKAAYDEVYQRWILPENMREFKMIIYVFERRTFLDPDFGIDDVNYDIPIKAFECSPCEFELTSQWGDSYDLTYESNNAEESKLVIKVKNVKTFYKNGLLNAALHNDYNLTDNNVTTAPTMTKKLWKQTYGTKEGYSDYKAQKADVDSLNNRIAPILIYDLVEKTERSLSLEVVDNFSTSAIMNSTLTVNGVRGTFMSKGILLSNLDFGTNATSKRTWVTSMVSAPTWSTELNFWQNLWNVTKQIIRNANRQIMIGGDSNLLTDKITADILDYLLPTTEDYSYISAACIETNDPNRQSIYEVILGNSYDIDHGGSEKIRQGFSNPDAFNDGNQRTEKLINILSSTPSHRSDLLLSNGKRGVTDEELNTLSDYKHEFSENLVPLTDGPEDVSQNLELLIDPEDPVELTLNELVDDKDAVEQQFAKMEKSRKIPALDLDKLGKARQIPDQDELALNSDKEIPELEMLDLEYGELPDYANANGLNTLEDTAKTIEFQDGGLIETENNTEMQDQPIEDPRELPKYQEDELEDAREIPELTYGEMEDVRSLPDQTYPSIESKHKVPKGIELIVMAVRKLPGFEEFTIEDALETPKTTLNSLAAQGFRLVPEFKGDKETMLKAISNSSTILPEQFVRLDKDIQDQEIKAMESLKDNGSLFDIKITDSEKDKQTILEIAKIYAENAPEIHKTLRSEILQMRDDLRKLSEKEINNLEEVKMYKLEDNKKENNDVLLTLEDVKQLDTNTKLIGLTLELLEGVSITTLVSLYGKYVNELQHTLSLISLKEKPKLKPKQKLLKLEGKRGRKKKLGSTDMSNLKDGQQKPENKIIY